ncbi:MAG TPA: SOS response-associated peptidase [Stellaceae bacterium]|jgi:putative SOS response-associated peptidase YedK|nr:SOS response-associated peptidase [Stellaceae bacterium]
MCARGHLSTDLDKIKRFFGLPPDRPVPNFAPTYNLAPTDPIPIVRCDRDDGQRRLDVVRWGLVPYWAKDIKIGYSTFNARSEEVETKPAFREAFRRRRCLVPLDSYYEWKKLGGKDKQAYAIARGDGAPLAMAGLWETWRSPAGEVVRSATIVTCPPNELCAQLHDRMPVIPPTEAWPLWLGEAEADIDRLRALLLPCPAAWLTIWPVDNRVGNVRNNDPGLVERVEPRSASGEGLLI